jgi:membrane fusion protein (multidrug efflux system)
MIIRRSALGRCAALLVAACCALSLLSCDKKNAESAARPATKVTALTVTPREVPVTAEFVAQTQSSQAVNIQARVSGFLDKRVYTEGSMVKAGQVLFRMDPKPFQAQVDAAKATLASNVAAQRVASANLARTKPLAEQNALSQADLDNATGQAEQANAAVTQAQAQLEEAELNLSYTTITSPVDGASSYAAVADGTYVSPTNAQLTTVSVLSPMWVNFSISENEMARIRAEQRSGQLKMPAADAFDVQIEMVDGTQFPYNGKITFADPSYNSQTGTFLIRVSVPNPRGLLRPNQYVRVRLIGATRPNGIMVPQRAVQQSAKGHFVWVVGKDNLAEMRPVDVGEWNGDDWFINQGLAAGDVVIVDGTLRLAPGTPVSTTPYVATAGEVAAASAAAGAGTPAVASKPSGATIADVGVRFATGSAALDTAASQSLGALAETLRGNSARIAITGYADATGSREANVALARARAVAVRDALVAAGVAADRLQLREPRDVIGSGSNDEARRVDLTTIS